MKVFVWAFGQPSDPWVQTGENMFIKRLQHYLPFEFKTIQATKQKTKEGQLSDESKWIFGQLDSSPTRLILLDERGSSYTSTTFSNKLENWRQGSHKRLVFLIGSSYGFDPKVQERADEKWRVSDMTLPHQICRLICLEQLYRACTILKGESYHHD